MRRKLIVPTVLALMIFGMMLFTNVLIYMFFGAGYIVDLLTLAEVAGFLALLYAPVAGIMIFVLGVVVVLLNEKVS